MRLTPSFPCLLHSLLHVLLRYYESTEKTRDNKVKDMLRTMGSSILMGGLSTLLGVVPLAFSTSSIIRIVFTMFFAMVLLGIFNGLIVLPVILSYWGPLVCVSHGSSLKRPQEVELQTSQSASCSDEPAPYSGTPLQITTDEAFAEETDGGPPTCKTTSPRNTSPKMRRSRDGKSWSWDEGVEVEMEVEV